MNTRIVTLAAVWVLSALLAWHANPQRANGAEVKPDVVYGRVHGAALVADVGLPSGDGPFPAIVSVHGGRWVGGSKTDSSTIKVAQWADLGFFSMSIDYRLTGCTPAPACYQDLLCAVRWVHAHAAEYHIDRERIFLIGQSAGGHLVSLAATLGDGPFPKTGGWDDQPSDFRAAISVAAPYDLVSLDWGKYWAPPGVDQETARRDASPIAHVAAKNKPLLIIHSDDDRSVPVQQAVDMVAKLEAARAKVEFHHYKDKGHMGITDMVIEESLAFIKGLTR
jgi:acetyl esterase/lipase